MGCLIIILSWAVYLFLVYTYLGEGQLSDLEVAMALGGLSAVCFITAIVSGKMDSEYAGWFYLGAALSLIGAIIKWIF